MLRCFYENYLSMLSISPCTVKYRRGLLKTNNNKKPIKQHDAIVVSRVSSPVNMNFSFEIGKTSYFLCILKASLREARASGPQPSRRL